MDDSAESLFSNTVVVGLWQNAFFHLFSTYALYRPYILQFSFLQLILYHNDVARKIFCHFVVQSKLQFLMDELSKVRYFSLLQIAVMLKICS